MDEHKKFLADRLLSEEQPVRSLPISNEQELTMSRSRIACLAELWMFM